MNCPNCGERGCNCTWDEMQEALRIIKRREAERRRIAGRKTVIESERDRQKASRP